MHATINTSYYLLFEWNFTSWLLDCYVCSSIKKCQDHTKISNLLREKKKMQMEVKSLRLLDNCIDEEK